MQRALVIVRRVRRRGGLHGRARRHRTAGVFADRVRQRLEVVGKKVIVVVEKHQPRPLRRRHRGVCRRAAPRAAAERQIRQRERFLMRAHRVRARGMFPVLRHDDVEIPVRLVLQTRQCAAERIRAAVRADQHRKVHAGHGVCADGRVCALKPRAARRLALRPCDGARRNQDAETALPQRARQRGDGVGLILREAARRLKRRASHGEARAVELARLKRQRMVEFRVFPRQRAHLHRAGIRRRTPHCTGQRLSCVRARHGAAAAEHDPFSAALRGKRVPRRFLPFRRAVPRKEHPPAPSAPAPRRASPVRLPDTHPISCRRVSLLHATMVIILYARIKVNAGAVRRRQRPSMNRWR